MSQSRNNQTNPSAAQRNDISSELHVLVMLDGKYSNNINVIQFRNRIKFPKDTLLGKTSNVQRRMKNINATRLSLSNLNIYSKI